MNCVVYMDLRPFPCAQFLGGLKLLKLGIFLLKMIRVLVGLKPLLPRLTSLLSRVWSNRMRDCLSKI